ncbi:MAG: CRISPR system precrRNA processing endoribonuclease RAMP protein Cas6 [Chloroflexi bacterium]|nr:CRISPR system precrRNA processing endoribonuclease RAMP protein Cas6 [Chloroflexota bacterium]
MPFVVHRLRFRAEVTSPLLLPPAAGAALRGALFGALRAQFCLAGGGPFRGRPDLARDCPVCFLLAPVDERNVRGQDIPRPYVLQAPSATARPYAVGETFEFGLATFGRALGHFPYALLGVQEMGRRGIGAGRSGGFRLAEVWAEDPLGGRQERLYRAGEAAVRAPALPIGAEQVQAEAEAITAAGGDRRLRLDFLSHTRLIAARQLVKPETFDFQVLFARLVERLQALCAHYGDGAESFEAAARLGAAADVRIVERRLVWQELFRASGRHERMLPMSGLLGSVWLEGDLRPFLPWLVWGSLTQVGKDATMGNGQYRLIPDRDTSAALAHAGGSNARPER